MEAYNIVRHIIPRAPAARAGFSCCLIELFQGVNLSSQQVFCFSPLGGGEIQKFCSSAFRIPHSVFRIPYAVSRIPYPVFRIPYSVFRMRIPHPILELSNLRFSQMQLERARMGARVPLNGANLSQDATKGDKFLI